MNLNALMFVWDQYIISADVTGYHEELLPVITAVILMIIRDQLMATKSVRKICLKFHITYFLTFKYFDVK